MDHIYYGKVDFIVLYIILISYMFIICTLCKYIILYNI